MAVKKIVERTTGGHTVEILVYGYAGKPIVESYVDGKQDHCQGAPGPIPAGKEDVAKAKGYTSTVGRVALTAEETEAVREALAAVAAEIEAETLAADPLTHLKSRRRALAEDLAGLREEDRHRREAAWEREDEAGAFRTSPKLAVQIAAAETALADFDAAHPEVLASIEAAEAAAVESFLARD
jgi:hypothetical protein